MTVKRLTPTLAAARQSRARLVWLSRRRRQAERHWSEAHSKALNELLKAQAENVKLRQVLRESRAVLEACQVTRTNPYIAEMVADITAALAADGRAAQP